MTSDTPDANAQTPAPGLRERIARIIDPYAFALGNDPSKHRVDYAPARNDALKFADAILAITDPQAVRKAALEEAARKVQDIINWVYPSNGVVPQLALHFLRVAKDAIRSLAASPAPTTDTKEA